MFELIIKFRPIIAHRLAVPINRPYAWHRKTLCNHDMSGETLATVGASRRLSELVAQRSTAGSDIGPKVVAFSICQECQSYHAS